MSERHVGHRSEIIGRVRVQVGRPGAEIDISNIALYTSSMEGDRDNGDFAMCLLDEVRHRPAQGWDLHAGERMPIACLMSMLLGLIGHLLFSPSQAETRVLISGPGQGSRHMRMRAGFDDLPRQPPFPSCFNSSLLMFRIADATVLAYALIGAFMGYEMKKSK